MTYELVARVSQIASLFLFMGLFAGALIYAFWPGNRETFEHASRLPLQKDGESTMSESGHEH